LIQSVAIDILGWTGCEEIWQEGYNVVHSGDATPTAKCHDGTLQTSGG